MSDNVIRPERWLANGQNSLELVAADPDIETNADAGGGHDLGSDLHQSEATPMTDTPSRTEIEAQIAASEARASVRLAEALGEMRTGFADVRTGFAEIRGEMRQGFAELRGQLATFGTRLDSVERATSGIKTTVVATGIAAVAVIIAVLAYGQTWFGIGISSRDVIRATVAEMRQTASPPSPPPAK